MLNGLALCAGGGGLDLGLGRWVRPVCYVENDDAAIGVLRSRIRGGHLPWAPIWDDLRTFDGLAWRGLVEIIVAGFPCQDLSLAGSGQGLEGERSALFFEVMRVAEEAQPPLLFLENVPGIRTRGLGRVGQELAAHGFDCRWRPVSAAEVGASQLRNRWFCLAYSHRAGKRKPRSLRGEVGGRSSDTGDAMGHSHDAGSPEPADRAKDDSARERPAPVRAAWEPDVRWAPFPPGPDDADGWVAYLAAFPGLEPAVRRGTDGLAYRVDQIRLLGGGVVPLQAAVAWEGLLHGPPEEDNGDGR